MLYSHTKCVCVCVGGGVNIFIASPTFLSRCAFYIQTYPWVNVHVGLRTCIGVHFYIYRVEKFKLVVRGCRYTHPCCVFLFAQS